MRKLACLGLVIILGSFAMAGCQTATSTSATKTMSDATAQTNSQTGINLAQTISGSMGNWAENGSITGVSGLSARGQSINLTGPDANGYYHMVQSTTESVAGIVATYEADLYVRLVSSESVVTDIYMYGSYTYKLSYSGAYFTYSQSYGSAGSPFRGTATWNALKTDVTKIGLSGSMSFGVSAGSAAEGSHAVAMTFTFTDYSLPVTAGKVDYPTGSIVVASTYDGAVQPTITLTFNGTATATMVYGDYTATFAISGG